MYLEEKRGANRKWQQEGLLPLSAKQEVQHFGNCWSSFKHKYDSLLPGVGIFILHKVVVNAPSGLFFKVWVMQPTIVSFFPWATDVVLILQGKVLTVVMHTFWHTRAPPFSLLALSWPPGLTCGTLQFSTEMWLKTENINIFFTCPLVFATVM